MQDIRALLKSKNPDPQTGLPIDRAKRTGSYFVTIHWNGPSVLTETGNYPGDINVLKADARWHVDHHGWDGLSYHYAIGRAGNEYQCRNWNAALYHAGNTKMNNESYAILVITGEGDPISDRQYAGLYDRLRDLQIDRRFWLGHQEAPRSTACPGALLMRWLGERRNEVRQPVSNVRLLANANVRDEPSVLSHKLTTFYKASTPTVSGHWRLGKPVQGDSLWLELPGDRYIHASALDTRSYKKVV